MSARKVFICGFSGSGKSEFLKKMEKSPLYDSYIFNDLDLLVCQSFGENQGDLARLVEDIGWESFREKENIIFKNCLMEPADLILALGGGSLNESNLDLLSGNKSAHLIWLDTPFEKCWERIKEGKGRPLVKNGKEELFKLYNQRLPLYQKADYHLSLLDQLAIQNMSDLFRHCGFLKVS